MTTLVLRRPVASPLTDAETAAVGITAAATVLIGSYGALTGAPSTVAYVAIVVTLTGALLHLRRRGFVPEPLPAPLVLALAAVAAAHLAGGLVRVGDDVLYNATAAGQLGRYDHVVHSLASFLGTLTCWHLFGRRSTETDTAAGLPVVVWLLVGLGLGAANETIEFLTTMLHHGSHVGGYVNTGWDLVSNLAGAGAATVVIARRRHP
jgi:hypothetical protein